MTCCNCLMMEYEWQTTFSAHNLEYLLASDETVEFYRVDTTSVLKNFVVLMYLFIFGDFLSYIVKREEYHCCENFYLKPKKILVKSSIFNAFDTFLTQFFSRI